MFFTLLKKSRRYSLHRMQDSQKGMEISEARGRQSKPRQHMQLVQGQDDEALVADFRAFLF